jgi:hypothetical protein
MKMATVSELLRSSWSIYKARIKTLLSISIVTLVLTLAVTPLTEVEKPMEDFTWTAEMIIFAAVLGIIYVFFTIWTSAATIMAIKDESLGFKSAFKESLEKVPYFLWIEILVGIFSLIGFVLFIIPGIVFSIWFCLAPLVFMFEGTKGLKALWASKAYVSGNFWAVLRRLVILGFVYLLFTIPTFILDTQSHVAANLYNILLAFVLTPYITVYTVQLYKALRDLKNPNEINSDITETNSAT